MEEQYYLINKEYLDNLITEHKERNWDSVQNLINSSIANALVNLSQKSTLIDLSDSAIDEAVDLDSSKVRRYDDGFDRKKGYRSALTNLKNKLNANK
jgi:hypothetical protein